MARSVKITSGGNVHFEVVSEPDAQFAGDEQQQPSGVRRFAVKSDAPITIECERAGKCEGAAAVFDDAIAKDAIGKRVVVKPDGFILECASLVIHGDLRIVGSISHNSAIAEARTPAERAA